MATRLVRALDDAHVEDHPGHAMEHAHQQVRGPAAGSGIDHAIVRHIQAR